MLQNTTSGDIELKVSSKLFTSLPPPSPLPKQERKPTPFPGRSSRRCIGYEMIVLVLDNYKFFVKTNCLVSSDTRIMGVFKLILREMHFAQ